jgi:ubiquinone/menaquinone biosynthesis C-methylase UbiE
MFGCGRWHGARAAFSFDLSTMSNIDRPSARQSVEVTRCPFGRRKFAVYEQKGNLSRRRAAPNAPFLRLRRCPTFRACAKTGGIVVKEADKLFVGSMPALYDRYLGPFIFEPYAQDLAERVVRFGPQRLLETAAGTGIVTRAMARALPATAAITATDLNQAMVDHAAAQTKAGNVTWRQADALALPFADDAFDAVVCQFGVMFFPDKGAGFREALRVLKPGGRFLFNVWDRIEENEISRVLTDAVAALFPADPPRFLARTPHGYHDVVVIRDQLGQAGFTRVEIETVEKRGRAPSPRDPAIGFCQGSPLRSEIEARDAGRLEEATEAAARAIAARFGPGPIEGKIQAHVVSAVR